MDKKLIILILILVIIIGILVYIIFQSVTKKKIDTTKKKVKVTQKLVKVNQKLVKVNQKLVKVNQKLSKLEVKLGQKSHIKETDKLNYKIKKLTAKQKYLKYILDQEDSEKIININLDNNSSICIIMTGDEKIYPFYGRAIDINYQYAQSMGYDFKANIGRVLDKNKYKPHFDRYKLLLNLMVNEELISIYSYIR